MSKKDKSKFKKQLKAQMLQDMQKFEKETKTTNSPHIVPPAPKPEIRKKISMPAASSAAVAIDSEIDISQTKYDLKKIGIIVGSIVVIIGAIYYLNFKYDILLTFGNWLFEVLHIE